MNTIKLGIQGASGRTGALLLAVLHEFPRFQLSAALVGPNDKLIGATVPNTGIVYSCDLHAEVAKADAWIDFSAPEASVKLAQACSKRGSPLLIATTGHSEQNLQEIKEASNNAPILVAANTSIGVFALKELSMLARSLLGDNFDVEISEIHHKHKKDAPSGTALYLGNALKGLDENFVYDRSSRIEERRASDIGVVSIRGGDVAGEHTVYFVGNGERVELTHRAWDRKVFARGALTLLQKIVHRPPALYALTKELFL